MRYTCDLNIFFRKSYVLKPSTAETQVDIFTTSVYHYKTHFIKILSWVLPVLILFQDVEVRKMVIFLLFLPFLGQFEVKNDAFLRRLSKIQKQISKYKDWPV